MLATLPNDCNIHAESSFSAATVPAEGFEKLVAFSRQTEQIDLDKHDWDWVCLGYRQRSRSDKRRKK